jgi:hypothetical protein
MTMTCTADPNCRLASQMRTRTGEAMGQRKQTMKRDR